MPKSWADELGVEALRDFSWWRPWTRRDAAMPRTGIRRDISVRWQLLALSTYPAQTPLQGDEKTRSTRGQFWALKRP
jgi:hypothetical protein